MTVRLRPGIVRGRALRRRHATTDRSNSRAIRRVAMTVTPRSFSDAVAFRARTSAAGHRAGFDARRRRPQSRLRARRTARGQRAGRSVDRVEAGEWTQFTSGRRGIASPRGRPTDRRSCSRRTASGTSISGAWRLADARGEPERLTTSPLPDGQPSVARDGRIVFVRGRLGAAALWVRQPNGSESRLTKDRAVEQWPAISPDGSRVAYVSIADGTRKLHVAQSRQRARHRRAHRRAHRASGVVAGRRSSERGRRRARAAPCTSRRSTDATCNLVSARHAESAWSPDGKTIALADIAPDAIAPVGYNGDPDRTGDRDANLLVDGDGQAVDGRRAVGARPAARRASGPAPRLAIARRRNADAFDQLWNRTAALYYSAPDAAARRAQWEALEDEVPSARGGGEDRTTSSRPCCTICCASIRRIARRRRDAPRCRARIRSRRRRAWRCSRRAATSSTRRSRCRSRSASSSRTRAARAATGRCSSIRREWIGRS